MDQVSQARPDASDNLKESEDWQEKLAKYPSLKELDKQDKPDVLECFGDGREDRLYRFVKNHKNLDAMKNNPELVLEAIDEFATSHEFMIHIGGDKSAILQNLILENKPRILVEFGGYCGYSAILFAEQMRAQASEARPVHVWSIEKEEQYATIARDLISLAGLDEYVTVITGEAGETLRKLVKDGKFDHIDFLFLDHSEDLYAQDLKVAMEELDLFRVNACIVADNVFRPGAPKYREYVRSLKHLRTRSLKARIMPGEFDDEIEISKILPQEENQETEEQRRGVGIGII